MAGLLCVACAAPRSAGGRLTGKGRLDRVRAALRYCDAVAPGVLRLKYADRADGVAAFGAMMARAGADLFGEEEPLLVPIPLHPTRLWRRRYNQAGLLADAVGRIAGVPVAPTALLRTRATPSQKGASARGRARNVAGAFAVRQPAAVKGRSVILIDDVLTTGATLLACVRPLRRAGAKTVSALTLARVIKSGQDTLYTFDETVSPT